MQLDDEPVRCPCCGAPLDRFPPLDMLRTARLTTVERALLNVLRRGFGEFWSTDYLLVAVWGVHDVSATPTRLRSHVHNLRGKLRAYPFEIESLQGHGYRLSYSRQQRAA